MEQKDILAELERLMKLYQAGVISKEELEHLKKKTLEHDEQTNNKIEGIEQISVPIDLKPPMADDKVEELINTETAHPKIFSEKIEEIKKLDASQLPENSNTQESNNTFEIPTPTKWYNVRNKLLISILFWPAFIYGFFKSELINTKLKYGIAITIILLIAYYITFSFINGNAYKMALKNAELIIKFNEGSTNSQLAEPNVEIHIIFEDNKIVSYTSNVDRYNIKYDLYGNLVFDSRFNEVKNYGYDLTLTTPLNDVFKKNSDDISEPWTHLMYISIDNITNYKNLNSPLNGKVTLTNSSYDFDKKKWEPYSDTYKATFIIINKDEVISTNEQQIIPDENQALESSQAQENIIENYKHDDGNSLINNNSEQAEMEKNLNDVFSNNPSVPIEETNIIEHEEDDIAYTSVEEMPSFPGGVEGLMKYIQSSLVFPEREKENGISGTVYVYFVINKEGNVEDAKIVRGVKGGVGLDNEALRVINAMPKWSIARQNGRPVKVQFTYPVKFVLK